MSRAVVPEAPGNPGTSKISQKGEVDDMPHHGQGNGNIVGKVHICPSGCVGLSFGPTVIHLHPVEFRKLLDAMQHAAHHLGLVAKPDEDAGEESPPGTGVRGELVAFPGTPRR